MPGGPRCTGTLPLRYPECRDMALRDADLQEVIAA